MESFRFIKTLNQIALAQTQLDTGVPSKIEEDRGFFDGLFGFSEADWIGFGLFVALPTAVGGLLAGVAAFMGSLGKTKECIRLFAKWLRAPFIDIWKSLNSEVFGGPLSNWLQSNPGLVPLANKARELWGKWKGQGGFRQRLLDLVDGINPSSIDGNADAIRSSLRKCINDGSLDKFVKGLMKQIFTARFPNLPKKTIDSISTFFEAFLDNGDLYALGISVASALFLTGVGQAGNTAYALAAELLSQGFVEEYGVGYTVIVGVLTAVLIGLSAFFLAGGTVAGIAAWLSSTASGIISTAAAGAGLSSAAIQRINEIIQQIARQVLPAT